MVPTPELTRCYFGHILWPKQGPGPTHIQEGEKETLSLDEWRSKAKRHRHREVGFTEDLLVISMVKNWPAMQPTQV